MAMRNSSGLCVLPVMGLSSFSFTKARFFAGLFRRASKADLSGM